VQQKKKENTMLKKLFFIFIMATLSGCATTGDPTQGGIFWSEDKAIQRQDNLKHTLAEEDMQGQTIQAEKRNLEAQRNASQAELERQRRLLSSLDAELNSMSKKLEHYRADTIAKQKEKQRIENEIRTFDQRIQALQRDTSLSVQEKKRKINILNNEMDDLLEIISSL